MAIPLSLSSVPSQTPYVQYVASAGQTVFAYPFAITQDSDLVVVYNGVTLATDTGYSLSGQGNATGGNVTFAVGATSGDIVTLYRDVAIQRISQIAQNSGFSSAVFNAEFNNIYLILQQLQADIAQCLQIPNTNNPAPVTTLGAGAYAGKYLAFDPNGNPEPAQLSSSGTITASLLGGLLFPETSDESSLSLTASTLAIPSGDALETPRRYGKTWSYRSDQHEFERQLCVKGAVFNGTTDDGPAISGALNAMVALGGYRRQVIFPSGGLTAKINSGFTIMTGALGVDFNGLKIDASGISSGNVVSIDQSASATYNPDSSVTRVGNLYLLGSTTAGNTPVMLSIDGLTSYVNNVRFHDIHIIGGYTSVGLVSDFWMIMFENVIGHLAMQYGLQYTGTTSCGENIYWSGGGLSNISNSGKTGCALYFPQPAANSNNQLVFRASSASFDGCDSALVLGQGNVTLDGCTFEGATGTGSLFTVSQPSTGPESALIVRGGGIATPGPLANILNISGGPQASAELDVEMNLWGSTVNVVDTDGTCPVRVNMDKVYFGGATSANFPSLGTGIARNYNGNFGTGSTAGFASYGTGITFTAQNTTVNSGSTYAGEIVAASATGGAQTALVPCRPGRMATVDCYAYVTAMSAGAWSLHLNFVAEDGSTTISSTIVNAWSTTDSGWTRQCKRAVAPAGTAYVQATMGGTGLSGTAYIGPLYIHGG